MTPAPDEVPGVTPPPSGAFHPSDLEAEITDEPEDVQERSPELFEEFLDKHEEAMEEATDDE